MQILLEWIVENGFLVLMFLKTLVLIATLSGIYVFGMRFVYIATKLMVMKKLVGFIVMIVLGLTSCDVIIVHPDGPPGLPGRAFFGIDYDYSPPYSYWDNNNSVPVDPFFGEYYRSGQGLFDFEYFVNRTEYWYGTYEIWTNPGGPGRPYGEPGRDGADTYLLLVCNPDGPYEWRKKNPDLNVEITEEGDWIVVEQTFENSGMRIKMQKTTTENRPSNKTPKAFFK